MPWCNPRSRDVWIDLAHTDSEQFIWVLKDDVAQSVLFVQTNLSQSVLFVDMVYKADALPSLVLDCNAWDSLGIGFADRYWSNSHGKLEIIRSTANLTSPPSTMLLDQHYWMQYSFPLVEQHVQRLITLATQVLHQRASQELTTTDPTRRVLGAFLDLSVTIVAIVAVASGICEMQAWVHRKVRMVILFCMRFQMQGGKACGIGDLHPLQHVQQAQWRQRPRHPSWLAAKMISTVIVILSVVMAPAFILIGEIYSHKYNADGKSSTMGVLAVDTDFQYGAENAVLVGAVAIRMKSKRDCAAFGLEFVNISLAHAASCRRCIVCHNRLIPRAASHRPIWRRLALCCPQRMGA